MRWPWQKRPQSARSVSQPTVAEFVNLYAQLLYANTTAKTAYSAMLNAPAASQKPAPPEPVAQEIIAWRGWRVMPDDDGWALWSPCQPMKWDSLSVVADKVPDTDHPHGLYAMKDLPQLDVGYCAQAYGEVALSGIVLVGQTGFRAERATVRSIVLLPTLGEDVHPIEVMAALEQRYQCDVAWDSRPTLTRYPGSVSAYSISMPRAYRSSPPPSLVAAA